MRAAPWGSRPATHMMLGVLEGSDDSLVRCSCSYAGGRPPAGEGRARVCAHAEVRLGRP